MKEQSFILFTGIITFIIVVLFFWSMYEINKLKQIREEQEKTNV